MIQIALQDVVNVYSGPEGRLWELVMGEQVHIGGFQSSMALADRAGIQAGSEGVDLCCCSGAGMRFLARWRNVARMTGVDATEIMIALGRHRCLNEGFDSRIRFVTADVTASGLPDASADFVWGEDAWCYVVDKPRLTAEAARLVKSGGMVAFTDWVIGEPGMSDADLDRLLAFMKFPNMETVAGWRGLLEQSDLTVEVAEPTDRFAPCVDLYLNMLGTQLTYDALNIIGNNVELFQRMAGEMQFMQKLAHQGRIVQGIFVARKK
ncbi:MAG: class I SAM-dependent methyltransferase [Candidatus Sumerlaeia bacterium]